MANLLDLPPELLAKIYDWLRLIEDVSRTWQFNSRALRPYTQSYRFNDVSIHQRRRLEQFARVVVRSPALGAAVRRAVVMIVPPREKDEDQPAVGLEETLVTMWHSLSQVRSVVIRTFRFGLDELLVAIGQGLELAKLESVELLFERDSSTSPYDLERWRTLVEAAPSLREVAIIINYRDDGSDGLAPVAGVPGPAFRSALTAMEVFAFPVPHEPALASLINAFPTLESLVLSSETQTARSATLPLCDFPACAS